MSSSKTAYKAGAAAEARHYEQGAELSGQQLVERYAPLVKRIAQHLMARFPASVQIDDLIQAGVIGLLEASRNYNGSKGASFETYAGIRIRGSMIDDVRKGDWAPRSVHRNGRRIAQAIRSVEATLGREASDAEIAEQLEVSLEDYYAYLKDSASSRLHSLDEVVSREESNEEPVDIAGPTPAQSMHDVTLKEAVLAEIKNLPERERLVLSLYYDEELNLKEIGEVLGVSESRVSQIHSQAMLRLRSRLGAWSISKD
ncbi:MAG: RNA polymerase sigma factor FliA [Pseudomonadales bacterium]